MWRERKWEVYVGETACRRGVGIHWLAILVLHLQGLILLVSKKLLVFH